MTNLEFRFVAERPPRQEGRNLIVAKSNAKKAAKALRDWRRDMAERYEPNGLAVRPAHIEAREVGPWHIYPEAELPND